MTPRSPASPRVTRRRFLFSSARKSLLLAAAPGITAVLSSGCQHASSTSARTGNTLQALRDPETGQFDILEGQQRVLRYNYATVEPGPVLEKVAAGNRIYAVARSNYIHPLLGLNSEELTRDWSLDHPHHRGIYWAWPEVDWRGNRGDLHALQKVFARPTGRCECRQGRGFAEIRAENRWLWENRDPIVRELATIRVWSLQSFGRWIDLQFEFTALGDPVQLARRGTDAYGGLNLRFSAVQDQGITKHTAPAGERPQRCWAEISGRFGGSAAASGVVILPHPDNPCHPGDWVDYPQLDWLQPTFPARGTRFELKQGQTLTLRYRLWVHAGGAAPDGACERQFDAWAFHSQSRLG